LHKAVLGDSGTAFLFSAEPLSRLPNCYPCPSLNVDVEQFSKVFPAMGFKTRKNRPFWQGSARRLARFWLGSDFFTPLITMAKNAGSLDFPWL
jgi:hypothetical protein